VKVTLVVVASLSKSGVFLVHYLVRAIECALVEWQLVKAWCTALEVFMPQALVIKM